MFYVLRKYVPCLRPRGQFRAAATIIKCGLSINISLYLDHLTLGKMAGIPQTIFSDVFSLIKSFVLRFSLLLRAQLTITGLDNGLATNMRQAFI